MAAFVRSVTPQSVLLADADFYLLEDSELCLRSSPFRSEAKKMSFEKDDEELVFHDSDDGPLASDAPTTSHEPPSMAVDSSSNAEVLLDELAGNLTSPETTEIRPEKMSRPLGNTEKNWCAAVSGGTGNTVVGVLFKDAIARDTLQHGIHGLQRMHPRLRCRLIHEPNGEMFFEVSAEPYAEVEVVEGWTAPPDSEDEGESSKVPELPKSDSVESEETAVKGMTGMDCFEIGRTNSSDLSESIGSEEDEVHYKLSMCQQRWLRIIEQEMNVPYPYEEAREAGRPLDLIHVKLFVLECGRSLVMIRAHTSVCDRVSAGQLVGDLLAILAAEKDGQTFEHLVVEREAVSSELNSVEDGIPRENLNKPFWARGIDIIGYGLGSRRHACLHFEDVETKRRTSLIRSGLSRKDTDALIQISANNNASLFGALCAAALKAAAAIKKLGDNFEHFAVTTMLNCRPLLEPVLSPSDIGFYHSAIMNTHHVGEKTEFWDLARRCHNSVENAIKNKKHFSDMGDLNLLMSQAMQHPNLTPHSSLRTSMLCAFRDPAYEEMQGLAEKLGIEDYIGCSSVHGVGPCFAMFDSVREDGLHIANVYPTPLFSRSQMTRLVRTMMHTLKQVIS